MVSPVTPVLANLWMEHFEEKLQRCGPNTKKLWKRYVDNIFNVVKGGKQEVNQYIKHLNSIHPKI